MMDDRELDEVLDRWRKGSALCDNGLGYKRKTIEHTLMVEGMVIRSTGGLAIDDPDCEKIDAIVSKMPTLMKKAIKFKYLFGWRNADAAKVFKMSLSSYKRFIVKCRKIIQSKMHE